MNSSVLIHCPQAGSSWKAYFHSFLSYFLSYASLQHFASLQGDRKMGFVERFWSKIKQGMPNDCWEWQADKIPTGYGSFRDKVHMASRLAYEFEYGPIPEGMFVLHKCDNPPCCNPSHLFLGTQRDNVKDRDAKGRGFWNNPDEPPHRVKFTLEQVEEIRRLYRKGQPGRGRKQFSLRSLGEMFGVHNRTIHRIVHGKTWNLARGS